MMTLDNFKLLIILNNDGACGNDDEDGYGNVVVSTISIVPVVIMVIFLGIMVFQCSW